MQAQKAEFLSMDDFLEKVQHIIMTGGHNFLMQRERLEKLTSLQLTQTIGKSQNFLTTALVQLREEILAHEKIIETNQENLREGLEKFFIIFNEYQTNLSNGLNSLATQFKPIKNTGDDIHQNLTSTYTLLTDIDNRLQREHLHLRDEISQLRSHLATVQYQYPIQGITDTINTAEARIKTLVEFTKEEILQNFDRNIKLIEDTYANLLLDIQPLKELPNSILRQNQSNHNIQQVMIKELHSKIDHLQHNMEKADNKAKAQENKIDILLKGSNKERVTIPIQRTIATQLKPPEHPLGGNPELNMFHLKNPGTQLKKKVTKKKPKMNWNEFGDKEWQIVADYIREQKLPPVRHEDLFILGKRPKGKTYRITKWGNYHKVNQIHQKFDVFHPALIDDAEKAGFSYISFGLFKCKMQGLHHPDPDVKLCIILVDERAKTFLKSIVGIGQLNLQENIAYFSVIPGFVLPLQAAKHLKLMVATRGYENYDIRDGIISVQHQSRIMFTNFAQDGLLFHIQRGRLNEQVLVRTSKEMSDYTFRKMPTKGLLGDIGMWNFPKIHPAPQEKYNVLDFVHQDENNNVSLKFGVPTKVTPKTNQELEEEFHTPPQHLMDQNHPRRSLGISPNLKRPMIKLQKSASSNSLFGSSASEHHSLNMMKIHEAQNFEQLETILKEQTIPSESQPTPQIHLNVINIDGDDDEVIKANTVFKTPVYAKDIEPFPTKSHIFEGKNFMAERPINPVGIQLNLDGVRNIERALAQWKEQMEICFTMNPEWDADSCHSYAELSMRGIVKTYIQNLKKGLTQNDIILLQKYEEEYKDKRNVDGYIYFITREFIGQTRARTPNEKLEQAKFKLSQLKLCKLKYIEEYSNNFKAIFYKCEDDSLKDEFFRKIPIIGEYILLAYKEWQGKFDGIQYLKDNTLGERINFTQDYISRRRKDEKERKLLDSAFSEIPFKDERDDELPIQWGCSEHKHRKNKSKYKKFKQIRDADFFPYKRNQKKSYNFRKSRTFKNPDKRAKKLKKRRYWKKNNSPNKKIPNYRIDKPPNTSNKECWTCGEIGHFAPNCPKKHKKAERVNMVETMLQYADLYDFDILYQVETIDIDEESVYSILTESTSNEDPLTSTNTDIEEEDKYFSSSDIQLNMVVIQDESSSSPSSSPYSKFENQTLNWKTSKWTLKHWDFRENPPPPDIPIQFYLGISRDIHLCEYCGYSTTNGCKEEDVIFINERYSLHFHKTCFLAVLQENRGKHAMDILLNGLGQYWKEVEEYRLSQYLIKRQKFSDAIPVPILTPSTLR